MFNGPSKAKWQKITLNRRAGILAPLFSVYSKDSAGIADLRDLKLLIDLACKSANSIVQLLPMNEVGPVFCPYDSVSSFALEPMYICLESVACEKNKPIQESIEKLKKTYPAGKRYVDYGIKEGKIKILREIYAQHPDSSTNEFKEFQRNNSYWLDDFALFKALKNYHCGLPWYEWQYEYSHRQANALEVFHKKHTDEINFQIWLQWQLYRQFCAAKDYAEKNKVLLKGDLPILVSRDSADVWQHPEFFKLEFASGAPPDMYCAKGQRWGMPTYNWEQIAANGYTYVKEKLKYAQNFYDILRVDHVVGLFRIWSIPYNEPEANQGLHGSFDPVDGAKWEEHGRKILSVMLESTDMLICAEDLGIIPAVCPKVLAELGILGNDVQRWAKDWNTRHDFLAAKEYRYLSVAMLSTHDTTNWPAWWEKEAGTVDRMLFERMCSDHRAIGFSRVEDLLFDPKHSGQGRLRWHKGISSIDKLVSILGKNKEELKDFIDLYQNTYQEKEKLWQHLGLPGRMREASDTEIIKAALKLVLESKAIFTINTLIDWLFCCDIFKKDSAQYRINVPGTVNDKNWSLVIPVPLDKLTQDDLCAKIKKMVISAQR